MDSDLLQRFMRRLDHIEFTVGNRLQDDGVRMREDLSQLQGTVGRIQKARRALDDESGPVAPAVGSHRGPGALPAPVSAQQAAPETAQALAPAHAPAPAQDPAHEPISISQGNFLERTVLASRSAQSSPGPRSAFSNSLVRIKQAAVERFSIGSPLEVTDESRVAVPMPALAPPAPAMEDNMFQSPQATVRPSTPTLQPNSTSHVSERSQARGDSCHARAEGSAPDAPQAQC